MCACNATYSTAQKLLQKHAGNVRGVTSNVRGLLLKHTSMRVSCDAFVGTLRVVGFNSFQLVPTRSNSFQLVPTRSNSFQLVPTRSNSFQLVPTRSNSFQLVQLVPTRSNLLEGKIPRKQTGSKHVSHARTIIMRAAFWIIWLLGGQKDHARFPGTCTCRWYRDRDRDRDKVSSDICFDCALTLAHWRMCIDLKNNIFFEIG